jgi:DNA mismatch repair protein MutS
MNEDKKIAETPLMKQYFSVKSKYPEAILLFRVGDFYETYGEDAIVASKILGIILTRRANGSAKHVEMAGFPYHAIDTYLPKLVRAGYKVAICDQLEDPKLAKKIVKRGITELVTPGVVYNEQLLTNKENNYLAAIYFEGDKAGVAFLDISTGSFKVSSGDLQYIELLLNSFAPKEILLQKSYKKGFEERFGRDIYISTMDEWAFVTDSAREKLQTHFGVTTLKGFGIDQYPLAITAAGAILYYLELTQHEGIGHICSISRIDEGDFVWIDRFTFRNLEVFKSASENGSSLTEVIDRTSSPMGARLLRNWLAMPVKNVPEIEHRQNIVEKFLSDHEMRDRVRQLLKEIGDQERIISRAAAGKITPREVVQLRRGLENTKPIKDILNSSGLKELTDISLEIDPCDELLDRLTRELIEDPASQLGKGDVIANGISQELDSLRKIVRHGKEILDNIQARKDGNFIA